MFSRCFCVNFKQFFGCQFSTTNIILKSHYDALGITPHATQTDIKAAYYKLSMLYHPDKNKGSVDASKKFQDISAAYEVLGNFRLRKLYDKGMLHTGENSFTQGEAMSEEHPEDKFYRSRRDRHSAPNVSGRTPIYDFDEWSRAHYGSTFERANRAREKYNMKMAQMAQDKIDIKNEMVIIAVTSFIIIFVIISFMNEKGYDNVDKIKSVD